MKALYLAGPYRAKTPDEVRANIHRAHLWQHTLTVLCEGRVLVLCPHTMTADLDGTMSDRYWLDATLELLERSDAIFMMPGFEDSAGSRGELDRALAKRLRVFHDCNLDRLREWALEKGVKTP